MDPKDQIKERLDIYSLLSEYLDLKRAGRNYKALSPFSNEKTPSFVVSPEKNIWHDFSSGKGGDIFTFVMEVEGLSFPDALKLLAAKAGVELAEYNPKNKEIETLKKRLVKINSLARNYFLSCLGQNPTALEYLKFRGFGKEAVAQFGLGYAPDSPDGLVKILQKHAFSFVEMEQAGVARLKSGKAYDIFRGRLMIPFVDLQGNVIGFTGRLIRKDGFGPKYLNTPQTIIYNKSSFIFALNLAKEAIRKSDYSVLLEGNMDVIASFGADAPQAVAASGTALTSTQIKTLQRFSNNLILSFDGDAAGKKATLRVLEVAAPTGLNLSVAEVPAPFKDADELIKSKGPASWQLVIESAKDAFLWLIDGGFGEYDLASPSGKGQFAGLVLSLIGKLPNPVAQESYRKVLAARLDVSVESLEDLVSSTKQNSKKRPFRATKRAPDVDPNRELKLKFDNFTSILLKQEDANKLLIKLSRRLRKLLGEGFEQISSQLGEGRGQFWLKLLDSDFVEDLESSDSNSLEPAPKNDFADYKARLDLIYDQLLTNSEYSESELLVEQLKAFWEHLKDSEMSRLRELFHQDPNFMLAYQKLSSVEDPKLI